MQASVKRLQRLQQVSDVLRRTSRFTTLAKRLQTQMAELGDGTDGAVAQPKPLPNSAALDGRRSATPGLDYEGERERLLAQAAVTIAELSKGYPLRGVQHSRLNTLCQATSWRFCLMNPRPYQRKRHRWALRRRPVDIFRSALSTQLPCTFR